MIKTADTARPKPALLLPLVLTSGAVLALVQSMGHPGHAVPAAFGLAVAVCYLSGAAAVLLRGRIPAGLRALIPATAEAHLAIQVATPLFVHPAVAAGSVVPAAVLAPVVLVTGWLLPETAAHRRTALIGYFIALAGPVVVFAVVRGAASAGAVATAAALVLVSVVLTGVLQECGALERRLSASSADRETLERLARTDALTELPNRRGLLADLNREAAVAARFGLPLAVIEFDLDHFKEINDVYGHQTGDKVLIAVARYIQAQLRATDVIGRLGGEEFLILAPGNSLAEATRLAEKLCQSLRQRPMAGGRGWVTGSFGVAVYEPGDTGDAILARVDVALYAAKRNGRDRVATQERGAPPAPAPRDEPSKPALLRDA